MLRLNKLRHQIPSNKNSKISRIQSANGKGFQLETKDYLKSLRDLIGQFHPTLPIGFVQRAEELIGFAEASLPEYAPENIPNPVPIDDNQSRMLIARHLAGSRNDDATD